MQKIEIPNIDAYIAQFPESTQALLQQMRQTILDAVPGGKEDIRYAMPTIRYKDKNLVHFAGYANHIGFYATPTGHEAFAADLAKYKQGKGSVQFPIDQPLPLDLVRRITIYRVTEMDAKGTAKKKK